MNLVRERKGIWTWYEGEMSGQSCAYKGHVQTSKETLDCLSSTFDSISKLSIASCDSTLDFQMFKNIG
jgi:hypothetical protein